MSTRVGPEALVSFNTIYVCVVLGLGGGVMFD